MQQRFKFNRYNFVCQILVAGGLKAGPGKPTFLVRFIKEGQLSMGTHSAGITGTETKLFWIG